MNGSEPDKTPSPTPPAAGPPESPAAGSPIDKALAEFAAAAAERQVEAICAAYQHLRKVAGAAGQARLFAMASKAIGASAEEMVVSAYARRPCFMCKDGMTPCEQCDGKGTTLDNERCPLCDGLGDVGCPFCRGSAWAERGTVPPDILQQVLRAQLDNIKRDVTGLPKLLSALRTHKDEVGPQTARREIVGSLARLGARITDLFQRQAVPQGPEYNLLQAVLANIGKLVKSGAS